MTASTEALRRYGDSLAGSFAHRRLDDSTRRDAELRVEQLRPRGVLLLGGGVVAGQPVQPDQQRLVVLVQRAHRGGTYGETRAPGRALPAPSAPGPPRAASPRPPPRPVGARRAATTRRPAHPGRPGRPAGRRRGRPPRRRRASTVGEHVDVDDGALREPKDHRVAVERGAVAETAADLRQAPPQRPQRIVGLGEQQPGQLAPGRGRRLSNRYASSAQLFRLRRRYGADQGARGRPTQEADRRGLVRHDVSVAHPDSRYPSRRADRFRSRQAPTLPAPGPPSRCPSDLRRQSAGQWHAQECSLTL